MEKRYKNIIISLNDDKHIIKILDNFYFSCDCNNFDDKINCKHIDKVKKFFKISE